MPATLPEPLRDHVQDPEVTDIFVNGAGGLFVDRGAGAQRVPQWRAGEEEVRELAVSLIALGGRHIDEATPCVDVRLAGGIRVHAVLPPVCADGTTISVRVPRLEIADLEGAGGIGLARLVREALRMRPDRLVVGECRGAEVRELLSALNTGHDGGAGTLHANGLDDVPARLEALGALAGLDDRALARQVASAIGRVVHLERGADGWPSPARRMPRSSRGITRRATTSRVRSRSGAGAGFRSPPPGAWPPTSGRRSPTDCARSPSPSATRTNAATRSASRSPSRPRPRG
ncbi:MAG: putative conjugal transfer protein [Microbacterium sp.]|nr:putative conjugal transfer protein [Microbacterium sp.]